MMSGAFKKHKIQRHKELDSYTDRQERIEGWRQDRMNVGRALILGAGALGNEVAKNLSLMGLGYMLIADFDVIDRSNLSRAVMFRKSDARTNLPKAQILAKRVKSLNVNLNSKTQAFNGDIVWALGTGVYRRVDVVIGCLDNVEARKIANKNSILTGIPYIDGGIFGLSGNVTSVNPPKTPCWECAISPAQLELANERYDSCSRVMKMDWAAGRLPTVQVASAIVAGFQTQEAVKVIQGNPWAAGTILFYSAIGSQSSLDVVSITRRPDCWCNTAQPLTPVELDLSIQENSLSDLISAIRILKPCDPEILFPAPLVLERYCYSCQKTDILLRPAYSLNTEVLVCPNCHSSGDHVELLYAETSAPEKFKECRHEDIWQRMLEMKLQDLGFPMLGWVNYRVDPSNRFDFTVELAGDAELVMGDAQFLSVRQ